MKAFSEKRPILFEILLVATAFVLAAVCALPCLMMGMTSELGGALGRILAGTALLIVFHRCFDKTKTFKGLAMMLPALIFALWNIANNFITKGVSHPPGVEILILALAPAIFEEVIFRGIFIHNLKASGRSDRAALILSALFFGAIHLTNALSGNIAQALVQTGYAVVVGLVFGAIYIRTGDLLSVIIAHALTDMTSHVFKGTDATSVFIFIAFIVILVVMAFYAFWLIRGKAKNTLPKEENGS